MIFMNTVICIISNILNLNNDQLPENLLYGKRNLDTSILDTTNTYLIETESFDTQLFYVMLSGCHGFSINIVTFLFCFVFNIIVLFFRFSFYFILFCFLFPSISQHIYVHLVIVFFFRLMCRY